MNFQKLWDDVDLISKFSSRKGDKFWLLDGPPYPNAPAHMGHVRGLTTKDMLIKVHAMRGNSVWIKPGFDTHGLPIENKVERELGIEGKDQIEEMGVSDFMSRCKEFATGNTEGWMEFYRDLGVLFGWCEPYRTLDKEYMDSVWWSVSRLWKKGLLKQGEEPFYWCPQCQTVLSGYEVTDEYHQLEDPSTFVKFPVKGEGFSLLAWTTTPWTLPGNVALVVRGDADYVRVKVGGEELVLARERLPALDSMGGDYEVLEEFKGKELEGLEYGPVIDCAAQRSLDGSKKARRVYLSEPVIKQKVAGKVAEKKEVEDETLVEHFTNLTEGTGVVHCAPGHGPQDFELGRGHGLPVLSPVDAAGRFTGDVEPFEGQEVRDSNFRIAEHLKGEGHLLGYDVIQHRYPVCWRCKTPLIFRLTEQWSLDIQQLKDKLLEAAREVEWLPEFAEERMLTWLANATDWTLSRQRYWNIPMPIWKCPGGHVHVVSGAHELERLSGTKVPDLHRDVVDDIHFDCPDCGAPMDRIPDVLDVWFDSGSASFAVPGYPRSEDRFRQVWPTDWIEEGQDQIRGWFYTLLVLGVALFDKAPYERVSMHGWVVDSKGNKMSKSKGNFVEGREALEELGPDVLRFYILWESAPWDLVRYDPQRARKEVGRMFHIWKHLYRYLVKFAPGEPKREELTIDDRWVLSKYNTMLRDFMEDLESYQLHHATRRIYDFIVEDFSRSYMKLAKERVRDGDQTPLWVMKQLHHGLLRLVAPIAPDFTEETYQDYAERFGGEESVLLEPYPEPDESLIDPQSEAAVDRALVIVEKLLAYRDEEGLGLRYPLRCVQIEGTDYGPVAQIIRELANVNELGGCQGDTLEVDGLELTIDSTMGEEELRQGYVREASRRVRSLRRKRELGLDDRIPVHVWGDPEIIGALKDLEDEFSDTAGASEVHYGEGGDLQKEWEFRGMRFGAGI